MRSSFGEGWLEVRPMTDRDREVVYVDWNVPMPQDPVVPKLASTVMLVRDSVPGDTKYRIDDGVFPPDFPDQQNIEVFMLRRAKSMDFVPDAVVFPGGRVDPRDDNPGLPWAGPTPAEWAEKMGCTEQEARQIVVAAVREVFEECGVLLAGPNETTTTNDLSGQEWSDAREALVRHELSFAEFLIEMELVIRTDLIGLVSNICTPPHVSKRFDTFFFAALLPEGQTPDDRTTEATVADWVTPAYAMREADADRWKIVPPTVYNLTRLAAAKSAASFVENPGPFPGKMMFFRQTVGDESFLAWYKNGKSRVD